MRSAIFFGRFSLRDDKGYGGGISSVTIDGCRAWVQKGRKGRVGPERFVGRGEKSGGVEGLAVLWPF